MNNKNNNNLIKRPPVVVIVGHIDHGKTTLLDYIRKSNITQKESGQITQHIGAYEITHNGEKITFIDTPGHEAFNKMRSRGVKVADIAILVVAADEGLKPQTKEAIKHIKDAGLEMIVAINKIDKPQANPMMVKQQLAEEGILLEGFGGNVSNQEISAKTGQGVNELLDLILLTAEVLELKADPKAPGEGVIIESKIDPKIGNVATLLIKNGRVKTGDFIVAGSSKGKIRKMENDKGEIIKEAAFSTPVQVIGFEELPKVGEEFVIVPNKKEAEKLAEIKKETESLGVQKADSSKEGKKILNVILKADVFGTKEALEGLINNLNFDEVAAEVVFSDISDVSEGDIKLAKSTGAIIAAFKVKIPSQIQRLADQHKINILKSDVVYELIENIKKELSSLLEPVIKKEYEGKLKVLATFKQDKTRMIIGGKVLEGKIKRGSKAEIQRDDKVILNGKIVQLQHLKEDVLEVGVGKECGIAFQPEHSTQERIKEGDLLLAYSEIKETKNI